MFVEPTINFNLRKIVTSYASTKDLNNNTSL